MTKTPLLRAESLHKTAQIDGRRFPILNNISLSIAAGEFVAIMGKSGSGKSTLLSLLAALDYPDSGKVFLGEDELTAMDEEALTQKRQDSMSFVFQSFHLLPTLTVAENIAFPLEIARKADPARVDELLTAVDLQHRRDSLPSQLSGGEQQRTALARALITKPSIIFADEPTGNLDEHNAKQVMQLLRNLQQASNTALVVVTHDEALAEQADRILRIHNGQL